MSDDCAFVQHPITSINWTNESNTQVLVRTYFEPFKRLQAAIYVFYKVMFQRSVEQSQRNRRLLADIAVFSFLTRKMPTLEIFFIFHFSSSLLLLSLSDVDVDVDFSAAASSSFAAE